MAVRTVLLLASILLATPLLGSCSIHRRLQASKKTTFGE